MTTSFGLMQPTAHLKQCRYIRQVLSSFGVVWNRSRLMRLDPRSAVPEHADINYQWFYRVRMHIPVVDPPRSAAFTAAGRACTWRRAKPGSSTTGAGTTSRIRPTKRASTWSPTRRVRAAFWQFVAQSGAGRPADGTLAYRPDVDAAPADRADTAAARDAARRSGAAGNRFSRRTRATRRFRGRPGAARALSLAAAEVLLRLAPAIRAARRERARQARIRRNPREAAALHRGRSPTGS